MYFSCTQKYTKVHEHEVHEVHESTRKYTNRKYTKVHEINFVYFRVVFGFRSEYTKHESTRNESTRNDFGSFSVLGLSTRKHESTRNESTRNDTIARPNNDPMN